MQNQEAVVFSNNEVRATVGGVRCSPCCGASEKQWTLTTSSEEVLRQCHACGRFNGEGRLEILNALKDYVDQPVLIASCTRVEREARSDCGKVIFEIEDGVQIKVAGMDTVHANDTRLPVEHSLILYVQDATGRFRWDLEMNLATASLLSQAIQREALKMLSSDCGSDVHEDEPTLIAKRIAAKVAAFEEGHCLTSCPEHWESDVAELVEDELAAAHKHKFAGYAGGFKCEYCGVVRPDRDDKTPTQSSGIGCR